MGYAEECQEGLFLSGAHRVGGTSAPRPFPSEMLADPALLPLAGRLRTFGPCTLGRQAASGVPRVRRPAARTTPSRTTAPFAIP